MIENINTLRITLIKSTSGRLQSHKDTIRALGLKKIHQTIVVKEIPSTLGMIEKVSYLLKIENMKHIAEGGL